MSDSENRSIGDPTIGFLDLYNRNTLLYAAPTLFGIAQTSTVAFLQVHMSKEGISDCMHSFDILFMRPTGPSGKIMIPFPETYFIFC